MTTNNLAPLFDFAVLDNADKPRSIVYNVDTGAEVATFDTTSAGQADAEAVCKLLNERHKGE